MFSEGQPEINSTYSVHRGLGAKLPVPEVNNLIDYFPKFDQFVLF